MDQKERERLRRRRREIAQSEPYPIGFAKPPDQHRFSATNQPKRLPKLPKTIDQIAAQIASEQVTMLIGGVPRRISRVEAMLRQYANKAMSGEARIVEAWIKLTRGHRNAPDAAPIDYAAEVRRKLDEMAARREEEEAMSTILKPSHDAPRSDE